MRQRCPWDAQQTPSTLRPYLVEEVMELDHALGAGDPVAIEAELGDLVLHVAFQIVLGEESGRFGPEDVSRAIEQKMWRRHPHLFPRELSTVSGEPPRTAPEEDTWERAKLREHSLPSHGVLDGLPPGLPPLLQAYRLQERAAGVGFDWGDALGPLNKVKEEIAELESEMAAEQPHPDRVEHEIGDLFFALVNLARKLDIDPRPALEGANARFAERFREIEALAAQRGVDMNHADLASLDELWDEVKQREAGSGKREG